MFIKSSQIFFQTTTTRCFLLLFFVALIMLRLLLQTIIYETSPVNFALFKKNQNNNNNQRKKKLINESLNHIKFNLSRSYAHTYGFIYLLTAKIQIQVCIIIHIYFNPMCYFSFYFFNFKYSTISYEYILLIDRFPIYSSFKPQKCVFISERCLIIIQPRLSMCLHTVCAPI